MPPRSFWIFGFAVLRWRRPRSHVRLRWSVAHPFVSSRMSWLLSSIACRVRAKYLNAQLECHQPPCGRALSGLLGSISSTGSTKPQYHLNLDSGYTISISISSQVTRLRVLSTGSTISISSWVTLT